MKTKSITNSKQKYRSSALFFLVLLSTIANAQIKLDYRNYLVPPSIIYSYQSANGGVAVPLSGTNKTWDYSTLVNTPSTLSVSFTPETNPAFSTCRRQQLLNNYYGAGFYATSYLHQKDNNTLFSLLGHSCNRSAYSLKNITGNINDSLIVLQQNVFYGGTNLTIPYPMQYLSSWLNNYNYVINLQISLASQGLNHAPVQFSTSIVNNRDVIGWGSMRIPTPIGTSSYIPCLLLKSSKTQVDSFFVNGAPANSVVLSVLGFTQGQTTSQYLYHFKRVGIEQDLATFYFTNSAFNTVDKVIYDRKYSDLYCSNNICHAKMCLNGITTACINYSNNAANNALLLSGAHLGVCDDNRLADEYKTNNGMAILYPNPSSNQFTLLLNDNGETNSTVSVYDFSGRTIKQFEEINGIIEFGNDFAPGIYFATIQTGLQKQIIKMVKSE